MGRYHEDDEPAEIVVTTTTALERLIRRILSEVIPANDTAPAAEWIGASEVASLLGCTKAHVNDLARRGDLPAQKVGKAWRFRLSEVEDWLSASREGRAV